MPVISNDIVYLLLLLFGAFAVAVHAYSMYGTPLSTGNSPGDQRISAVLDSVSLNYLGGSGAYTAGLLCYLGINEFLFLVLSSSSVILELTLSVIGGSESVGAMTLDDSELNPLTPVLASSVIMTIGQIKPFSQIENAIRRISHHVAGIPSSVYETVSRINTFEFHRPGDTDMSLSDSVADAVQFAEKIRDAATGSGLDTNQIKTLAGNVLHVLSLHHWTYGADGERMWSGKNLNELKQAIALVQPRVMMLEDKLKTMISNCESDRSQSDEVGTFDTAALAEWQALLRESANMRREINELFAVLVINQPGAKVPDEAQQISRLLSHVRFRKQSHEINALFGSGLIGLALSVVAVFGYYALTQQLRDLFGHLLYSVQPALLAVDASGNWWSYMIEIARTSIEFSLRDVMNFGLIFVVSAAVALSIRATRLASNEWTPWGNGEYPFRQYLSVAFMASVIAFLFYTLLMFYSLVISPSLQIDGKWLSPSLLKDFRAQYAEYLLVPLTGVSCAWVICLMSDETLGSGTDDARSWLNEKVATAAFRFAALSGIIHAVIRIRNGSVDSLSQVTESLLVPAIVFFLCFHTYGTLHRITQDVFQRRSAASDTNRVAGAERSHTRATGKTALRATAIPDNTFAQKARRKEGASSIVNADNESPAHRPSAQPPDTSNPPASEIKQTHETEDA